MKQKPEFDPLLWLVSAAGIGIAIVVFSWLMYLFVSVVFGGASTSCPQNLC